MKPLIKIMLIMAVVFSLTLLVTRVFGILTIDNVRTWLEWASQIDPWILAGVVISLLFLDLFVAVPTLTITLLTGYFLGFTLSMVVVFIGLSLAVFSGYGLSRKWGHRAIAFVIKDDDHHNDLISTFHTHGPIMIVLSRAAPMLPEITACLAGATHMPFWKYTGFFLLGTVPYIALATYAGSISDIDNPMPAIYAALFLYGISWLGWLFFRKRYKKRKASDQAD